MNKVEILKEDSLDNYMNEEHLVVVFTTSGCGKCKLIIPELYKAGEHHKIVVVDSDIHVRSMSYYPRGASFYPTLAYFKEGKFIKTVSTEDIKGKRLWK
jgi:thiol-disulfide isomerase/thioredoxin|tara:strand:+ start:664 stop:960 length:297 start_codon:yes stop_codon:yes gene_type:complete